MTFDALEFRWRKRHAGIDRIDRINCTSRVLGDSVGSDRVRGERTCGGQRDERCSGNKATEGADNEGQEAKLGHANGGHGNTTRRTGLGVTPRGYLLQRR